MEWEMAGMFNRKGTYVYQSFSTMLDKSLRKSIKRRGGGDIGKHKLNEMGALNMKYKK